MQLQLYCDVFTGFQIQCTFLIFYLSQFCLCVHCQINTESACAASVVYEKFFGIQSCFLSHSTCFIQKQGSNEFIGEVTVGIYDIRGCGGFFVIPLSSMCECHKKRYNRVSDNRDSATSRSFLRIGVLGETNCCASST